MCAVQELHNLQPSALTLLDTVQTWVQSVAPKNYFSFTLPHQLRTLEIFNLHQPRTGIFA